MNSKQHQPRTERDAWRALLDTAEQRQQPAPTGWHPATAATANRPQSKQH